MSSIVLVQQPSASYSTEVNVNSRLSSFRRGTGGRSSFNGIVATVFGCNGLLGTAVCNKLGKTGTQLVLPYRGEFYDVQHLKLCGDLGQVLFTPYNLKDENSIRKALKHSNLVINVIGREWETKNFSFDDIYVKGIKKLLFQFNCSYTICHFFTCLRSTNNCSNCQGMWSRANDPYFIFECNRESRASNP